MGKRVFWKEGGKETKRERGDKASLNDKKQENTIATVCLVKLLSPFLSC